MSEHEESLSRRDAVAGALAGRAALSLPQFLEPGDALAAGPKGRAEAMALFLGQDELPVPPKSAKVHTSACQFCNVGCGYKIYTWPVSAKPVRTGAPKGPLGEWISPAMVTRAKVGGRECYVAVVPDQRLRGQPR